MRVVVFHSGYGCDTGCCGHSVQLIDDEIASYEDEILEEEFAFSHPYGQDNLEWAKELVKEELGEEHVADLDWENCLVVDD